MSDTYKMKIAGLERELPICPVSDTLNIAAFVMFGDVEITEAVAAALTIPSSTITTSIRVCRMVAML